MANQFAVGLGEGVAGCHLRPFQQIKDLTPRAAADGQIEELQKNRQTRVLLPQAAVGNGVLDVMEDGRDDRRIFLDVRGHHHNIPQLHVRVFLEPVQDLILENHHLPDG